MRLLQAESLTSQRHDNVLTLFLRGSILRVMIMARKIEVLVLRGIRTESAGIIRKGKTARLSGKEMEHYVRIGAVQRPEFTASEIDEPEEQAPTLEGGDT